MGLTFSDSVVSITNEYMLPNIIKSIAGSEASEWFIKWQHSPENEELQKTIGNAWATHKWKGLKVKSPLDKRTKTGKHIAWLRDKMHKQFEEREGEMPYTENIMLRRILANDHNRIQD